MDTSWKPITADQAVEHSLYGIKGWLAVFAVSVLIGLAINLGSTAFFANAAGLTMSQMLSIDHPAATFAKVALAVDVAGTAVICWMLFTKHPNFRTVTTWFFLGSYPAALLLGSLNPYEGFGADMAKSFFSWVISSTVWVTFLNQSKRVRMTFEHMVRADTFEQAPLSEAAATKFQPVTRSERGESAAPSIPPTRPLPKDFSMPPAAAVPNDETIWASSLAEFESDKRRPGLWAKSFADSKGNESLAKATYLASRVKELQSERQATLHQQEEARQQVQDQQKLDAMAETERRNYLMPKGQCPNCQAIIPLSSSACPKCKAMFGPDSAWKLQP